MQHKESIDAAIMFTDIKDFTLKTSLLTQKQVNKLLDDHDVILYPIISKYFGKTIKTIGDSYMVIFETADNAIAAAKEIQKSLDRYNKTKALPLYKIEVRISIDFGAVSRKETLKGEDYFGEPVNIASRMQSIALENRVFVSQRVFDALNTGENHYRMLGKVSFKGVMKKIELLDVLFRKNDLNNESQLEKIDLGLQKTSATGIKIKEIDKMIFNYASVTAILGIQPIPFFDIYGVIPLHMYLLQEVAKKHGVKLSYKESKEIFSTLVSSLGATYGFSHGIMGVTKLGMVGFGGYVLIPFNFALTYAIGKILNLYFYYDSRGEKLNKKELKSMFEFSRQEGMDIAKKDKDKIVEMGKRYKEKLSHMIKKFKEHKK